MMSNRDTFLDKISSKLAVVARDGSFIPIASPAFSDAFTAPQHSASTHLMKPLKQRNLPLMAKRFNSSKTMEKLGVQSPVGLSGASMTTFADISATILDLAKMEALQPKNAGNTVKPEVKQLSLPIPIPLSTSEAQTNDMSAPQNDAVTQAPALPTNDATTLQEESIAALEKHSDDIPDASHTKPQKEKKESGSTKHIQKQYLQLTFKDPEEEGLSVNIAQIENDDKETSNIESSQPEKSEEKKPIEVFANKQHQAVNEVSRDLQKIPSSMTESINQHVNERIHKEKGIEHQFLLSSPFMVVEAPVSIHGSVPITYSYTIQTKESTQLEKHMLQKVREWNLWEVAMLRELTRMVEPVYAADKLHEAAAQGLLARDDDGRQQQSQVDEAESSLRKSNKNHPEKWSLKLGDYDFSSTKHGFSYLKMSDHNGSMYSANLTFTHHSNQQKKHGYSTANIAYPIAQEKTLQQPRPSIIASHIVPAPIYSSTASGRNAIQYSSSQNALIGTKISGIESSITYGKTSGTANYREQGTANKGASRGTTPLLTPWGSTQRSRKRAELIASRNSVKPKKRIISIQNQKAGKDDNVSDAKMINARNGNGTSSPEQDLDDKDSTGNISELHPAEFAFEQSIFPPSEPPDQIDPAGLTIEMIRTDAPLTPSYDLDIPQAWDSSPDFDVNLIGFSSERTQAGMKYVNEADVASPANRQEAKPISDVQLNATSATIKSQPYLTTEWKLGSLGPDIENEEYQAKIEKRNRQKEYAEKIRKNVKKQSRSNDMDNVSLVDADDGIQSRLSTPSSPSIRKLQGSQLSSSRNSISTVKLPHLSAKAQVESSAEKKARIEKAKAYAASIKKPEIKSSQTKKARSTAGEKRLPPINNSRRKSESKHRADGKKKISNSADLRELEEAHLRSLAELESIKKELRMS